MDLICVGFRVLALAAIPLTIAACGADNATPPGAGGSTTTTGTGMTGGASGGACAVGASVSCACADGQSGAQTCLANHTFGQCMCTGMPPVLDSGGMPPVLDSGGMPPLSDSSGMVRDGSTGDVASDASGDALAPVASVPDPRDAVIYQVNLRAFSANGFQGVINRLDQIQALGVNVVYLMPVTPVGMVKSVNSPYCVQNYEEVNPELGT